MEPRVKAVKLNGAELEVVALVKRKLGLHTASDVLRMGLRALAREQQLDHAYDPQPPKAA